MAARVTAITYVTSGTVEEEEKVSVLIKDRLVYWRKSTGVIGQFSNLELSRFFPQVIDSVGQSPASCMG